MIILCNVSVSLNYTLGSTNYATGHTKLCKRFVVLLKYDAEILQYVKSSNVKPGENLTSWQFLMSRGNVKTTV